MRTILLLLLLAIMQTANGQDYCSRIKKEVSDDKKTFEYASPFDPAEKPTLRLMRSYNNDPEFAYDNFFLVFRIEGPLDDIYVKTAEGGQTEKDEKALVVEFDDNTKFTDDDAQVSHDVSDDHTQSVRFFNLPLSNDNLKDFTSKKIVKFSLAGISQPVIADSATSIREYTKCMKTIK